MVSVILHYLLLYAQGKCRLGKMNGHLPALKGAEPWHAMLLW